jgi:hypothetical protein
MTKESINSLRGQAIFRETFNSVNDVRLNGGISTAVDFDNGVGSFLASEIVYKQNIDFTGNKSFRFKLSNKNFSALQAIFWGNNNNNAGDNIAIAKATTGEITSARTSGSSLSGWKTTSKITTSDWYELVVTKSATAIIGMYINGVLDGAVFNRNLTNTSTAFSVGAYPTGATKFFFNGDIDLFEIYDYVLNATEVKMLYNETLHTNVSNKAKYGSEIIINGDFSNGTTNWVNSNTNISVVTIDGQTALKVVGATTSSMCIYQYGTFVSGKRYRIKFDYYIPSSNTSVTGVKCMFLWSPYPTVDNIHGVKDVWNNYNIEYSLASNETAMALYQINAADAVAGIPSGDILYITNVSVQEVINSELVPILECDFVKNKSAYNKANESLTPVLTDCEFAKQGLICNNPTTNINTGITNTLMGDLTVEVIIDPTSYGVGNWGRIIDNEKLLLLVDDTTDSVILMSNGSNYGVSATDSCTINGLFKHFIVTRTSTGITNFYLNGTLSGTANQSSGTPVAGTTNIHLMNRSLGSRAFNGGCKVNNIYQGIMTEEQITKKYNYYKSIGYLP